MAYSDNPLIFQVKDPQGRSIGLYRNTWEAKILRDHDGIDLEWVKQTIEDPVFIIENEVHGSLNYLSSVTVRRFRLVAVKPKEGRLPPFIVVSAYPVSIPPFHHGRIVWTRS